MNKFLKVLTPILLSFTLIACQVREVQLTPQEKDSEIMNARKYIANYDQRMEKVQKYIIDCLAAIPEKEKSVSIEDCRIIAYDTNGFFRSDSNISQNEKAEYQSNLKIAQKPLSTEAE